MMPFAQLVHASNAMKVEIVLIYEGEKIERSMRDHAGP
ncbi:hypothetical protein BN2497_10833 [Janthinobacterium sp. CG23_2]|nr:hypothetical protein BN2497_10833 [Janthinobacterium sp. CG23_2]CUU31814.1 hypothetical protein BN3177_10833 [Janthinobacterium sp. CG23_2]